MTPTPQQAGARNGGGQAPGDRDDDRHAGRAGEKGRGTLVGYARVSTVDQHTDLQHDALHRAGVVKIFTETVSGAARARPELAKALDYLRDGDTLVVWRLDRLGRSLPDLIARVRDLEERGIEFTSLTEGIDTTTPGGRLTFHLMGALAEFERDLIRERTRAGLAAARDRGRVGGRPSAMTTARVTLVRQLVADHTYEEVAEIVGVSRSTVYRTMAGAYDTTAQTDQ